MQYGNARWGEKYAEAARITGIDAKTLRNIVYVASRFELSRRRDNLTWTHHAEVAALEASEQEEWLDRAVDLRLSATDLRVEIRSSRRLGNSEAATGCNRSTPSQLDKAMICPHCGNAITLTAEIQEQMATGAV